MKVFIVTDMEGATGVVHRDQLTIDGKEYARARKLLTQDINAAVQGAVKAGAKEMVVCDGHGSMRNILLEELDEHASLILGPTQFKDYCQIIGMDESFDAAIFVAFHAMAGNESGVLSHTWVGNAIHHIKVNDTVMGETGLNAAICGEFGIPVVAVTGDDVLAVEAQNLLQNPNLETIIVKKAWAQTIAQCYPPKVTAQAIESGVTQALRKLDQFQPFRIDPPITLEIGFYQYHMARKASLVHGIDRITDSVVRIQTHSFLEAASLAWTGIKQALLQVPEWMG